MSLWMVRCMSRTEALPILIVELGGGASTAGVQPFRQLSQTAETVLIALGAQVLEEAECLTSRPVDLAIHALNVILVAVAKGVDKRVERGAHRALVRAHRPCLFRQCPRRDTM